MITKTPNNIFSLTPQYFLNFPFLPSHLWLINISWLKLLSLKAPNKKFKVLRLQKKNLHPKLFNKSVLKPTLISNKRLKAKTFLLTRQLRPSWRQITKSTPTLLLHSSKLWNPTFLNSKKAISLLGPSLKQKYFKTSIQFEKYNKKVTSEDSFKLTQKVKQLRQKNLYTSTLKRQLTNFKNFIYSKTRVNSSFIKLPSILVSQRRSYKTSAYLFLGLKRAPETLSDTPIIPLWQGFKRVITKLSKQKQALHRARRVKSQFISKPSYMYTSKQLLKTNLQQGKSLKHLRRWRTLYSNISIPQNYFTRKSSNSGTRLDNTPMYTKPLPLSTVFNRKLIPLLPLFSHTTIPTRKRWNRLKSFLGLRARLNLKTSFRTPKVYSFITSPYMTRKSYRFISNQVLPTFTNLLTTLFPLTGTLKPFPMGTVTGQFRPKFKLALYKYLNTSNFSRKKKQRFLKNSFSARTALGASTPSRISTSNLNTPLFKNLINILILNKRLTTRPFRTPVPLSLITFKEVTNNLLTSHNFSTGTKLKTLTFSIKPIYSTLFTTSPFFFIHRILTSADKIIDTLRATTPYNPRLNYLIFPEANSVKTSIFRRLNRQKFLLKSRTSIFNEFALTPSLWKDKPLGQDNLIHNKSTNNTSYKNLNFIHPTYSPNWIFLNSFNHIFRAPEFTPRIKRIRFKPGYYRIWRLARVSAKELFDIKARYQYRLTPKLQKHYFWTRGLDPSRLSLTLGFALLTARLVPDHWSLNELINSSIVFLNGQVCGHSKTRLFFNDFIQLVVSLKYYISLRWLKSWSIQKQNRVSKVFFRKFKPSTFNKDIKLVRTLPYWFFDLQYTYVDIPKYFEVDFFTLSIFLVHDFINRERWLPTKANQLTPHIVNMYNWKYIT